MIMPDFLEQHGAGHKLPRMAHQIFEKRIFARKQIDGLATALYRMGEKVHLQIADPQHGFGGRGLAAPDEDIDARGQFQRFERFRQIVVTAGFQAAHPFVDGRKGAENQHGGFNLGGSERSEKAEAVHMAGQHSVEHDGIEAGRGGFQEPGATIIDTHDRTAVVGQGGGDLQGRLFVIFYDQHSGQMSSFTT